MVGTFLDCGSDVLDLFDLERGQVLLRHQEHHLQWRPVLESRRP